MNSPIRSGVSLFYGVTLFCVFLVLIQHEKIHGQQTNWNVPSGNFNSGGNWTAGTPTSSPSSNADIANGGTATVTDSQCVGGTLDLGRGSNPGFLQIQSGGYLCAGFLNVNSTGQGSAVTIQTGGSLVCSTTTAIGFLPNCTESGSMTVQGVLSSGVVQIDGNSALQVINGGVLSTTRINAIICGGSGPSPLIFFDSGTFQPTTSGQDLINGPTNLGAGGITFNNGGNSNYITGAMSGAGGATVTGGGQIQYIGDKLYTGPTSIRDGANLLIDNNLPNSNVTIFDNSMLSGIGNIGGTVTNTEQGTVSPGDPNINGGIGTMNTGSYTQGPNATLAMELGCPPELNHDLLEVTGMAQLAGTLKLTLDPACDPPAACAEIPLVTATQGVSGAFTNYIVPNTFPYRVIYTSNQVLLKIPCLDGAVLEPNLSDTLEDLTALMGGSVGNSLPVRVAARAKALVVFNQELTPIMNSRIKDIIFNATNTQYGQMTTGLAALRAAGASSFIFQGLTKDPMTEQFSKRDAKIVNRKGQTLAYIEHQTSPWSIFLAASGVFSKMNHINDLPKLNSITGYFVGGANYTINEYINAGLYAGYQGITARYGNGSRLRSNGVKFGAYGTAQCPGFLEWCNFDLPQWASQWISVPLWATQWSDNFYINAMVGGGINYFNLRRNINIQSMFVNRHSQARGYPLGGELDSLLGGGYEFNLGSWRFGLNTSIQYTYFGLSAFNESGAGDLNVRSSRQNPSSLVYTLGGNVSYLWEFAPGYFILPTVGLYWQHEFLNYGQSIGARFANGRGTAFNMYSSTAARNNAFGMAGITAEISSRIAAYAYYNPQFGGGQIVSQGVLVGLTYSF